MYYVHECISYVFQNIKKATVIKNNVLLLARISNQTDHGFSWFGSKTEQLYYRVQNLT